MKPRVAMVLPSGDARTVRMGPAWQDTDCSYRLLLVIMCPSMSLTEPSAHPATRNEDSARGDEEREVQQAGRSMVDWTVRPA